VKTLRGKYDELGKTQLKGLAELDGKFAPIRQELGQLKRQFLDPKGGHKDSAYSTLANLTNKGREQTLARLEKYVPGITEEINVLRAIEDIASAEGIKVGTYARGAATAGLALTNVQAGLIFFLMTHPSVAVPILREAGNSGRVVGSKIDSLLTKIKSGKKLNKKDAETFIGAVDSTVSLDEEL
jgi:ribosomal protein L2